MQKNKTSRIEEKPFICEMCGHSSSRKWNIVKHKKDKHEPKQRQKIAQDVNGKWSCSLHEQILDCTSAKKLRLHLFYFHRLEDDASLMKMGFTN